MGKYTRQRLLWGAGLLALSAAAWADNAMTTESADLYAGPDNAYPVVAQLDSNTPIQVMGCLDDWSWCDVSVEDTRGWLYSPDITYAYQGGYVPLYSYAPALGVAVVSFSVGEYWGHYYPRQAWYSRRAEWEHRTVEHRRPPGPPPSARPPPRPEHREAARHEDHPVHMGNARPEGPPPRPEEHRDDRHGSVGDNHAFARPNEPPHPAPEQHARPPEPPRPEAHAMPAPNQAHEAPRGAPHEAPHEEHARPNVSHEPPPAPKHEEGPPH